MPPLPVALALHATLPWLSSEGRAAVSALAAARGDVRSADDLAHRIGIGTRFQLARMLRRDGLPPFGRLTDWVCVLYLLWEAEVADLPMLQLAERAGMEPATCYRRCKRALGIPWTRARAKGFGWALLRLVQHCRRPLHAKPHQLPESGEHHIAHLLTEAARHPWVVTPPVPFRGGRRGPALVPRGAGGSAEDGHPRGTTMVAAPLEGAPTDIHVSASGIVYVTRAHAGTVERFDVESRRSDASISVGHNPTRIAFDDAGRRAYVTNQFGQSISVIDVNTATELRQIPVAGDPAPIAINTPAGLLYVSTNLDLLYAIDLRTERVVATVALPATSHHLALSPARDSLYVATRAAGTVLELDTVTHHVRRVFDVGGRTQALRLAPDGAELYVANEGGSLDVVDLVRGVVSASLRVQGGAFGVDASPDQAQLYVTVPSLGRVQIIDRASLRTIATLATGGIPRHTAFVNGGRTALIVNEAGWISLVS